MDDRRYYGADDPERPRRRRTRYSARWLTHPDGRRVFVLTPYVPDWLAKGFVQEVTRGSL
jgi:hypothetical protein